MPWSVLVSPIASGVNDSGLTINVPAGVADNDILLLQVLLGSNATVTTPAGWTLLAGPLDQNSASVNVYVFYRVAASEPASYAVAFSGTATCSGAMLAYRGGDPAAPIDASNSTFEPSSSTSHDAPALSTGRDGNMVVTFWGGWKSSAYSWTPPAGTTERYDGGKNGNYVIMAADLEQATAGSTGTLTATSSVSIDALKAIVSLNVKNQVDIASTGATGTGAVVRVGRVRDASVQGATGSGSAAGASRIRGIASRGGTATGGVVRIRGGSVYIRSIGGTAGGGVIQLGRIRPARATGATASGGIADPEYVRNVGTTGATGTGAVVRAGRVRAVTIRGATENAGRVRLSLANQIFGRRLRLDLFDGAEQLVGRVWTVLAGSSYHLGQDQVGDCKLNLPANDPNVTAIIEGQRFVLYREGEGAVFSGFVETVETTAGDAGETVVLTGSSRARELVWLNTLTGRNYQNVTRPVIVDDLLAGSGWTAGTVTDEGKTFTAGYIGLSLWAALVDLAKRTGWHVRERNLTAEVDLGPFGEASGLVARRISQSRGWSEEPLAILPLLSIKITDSSTDIWNEITPLGGGEGPYALNLALSDRTEPYPIKTRIDGTGQIAYYIEDTDSINAHRRRQQLVINKDITPLDNSNAGQTAAANMLYDQAVAFLQWHKEPVETYEIAVTGLVHYDHGQPMIQVGQTLRLQYRGYVGKEIDGRVAERVTRDIDADLHVLELARTFAADGSDTWQLKVSTSDQAQPSDVDLLNEVVARAWALETARRPFTMQDTAGPLRDSVDSSHPFKMEITFDGNVTRLAKAKLEIFLRPVRSNTKSAASGGGATSSGGSAHRHTVSGMTAMDEADPLHSHQIGVAADIVGWVTPAYKQQFQFAANRNGTASYGVYVGRDGTTLPWTSVFTFSGFSHNHAITATTSNEESAHTHQISPHSHSLQYGIFEGPSPNGADLTLKINGVDVTAELGGPWNDDVTLDITRFLVDEQGRVLRTTITVEIGSQVLADVIVTLKSIITIQSIVPV